MILILHKQILKYFTYFIYLFYLYIYSLDLQESDRGANTRVNNFPTCFQRCQNIAVRLKSNRDMTKI